MKGCCRSSNFVGARDDYLHRWPVSKRVNSSTDADDATLIDRVELEAA
jgi:hypothetical protein